MKLNLRVKSKLLIFILTFAIVMACSMNFTYSEDSGSIQANVKDDEMLFEFVEYSDAYKKWLALPEEERINTSAPLQYDVKYTPSKLSLKNMLLGEVLPSKFDWRGKIQINVKNQGNTNFCWAYGATSTLETHLAAKNQPFEMYSPRHMDYATSREFTDGENPHGFNRIVNDGGHMQIAMAYYTSGFGPVKEEDMPFINSVVKLPLSSIENKEVQKQVKEYVYFPSVLKIREGDTIKYINSMDGNGNELTEQEVIDIRNRIKSHIMENGGVGMTYNNASMARGDDLHAYVPYTDNETYHDVCIVGWDDNYSKDNFSATPKPLHDGAWIVLNSWGTESGEDGFFYISYDDMYVESRIYGICSASDVEYDNLYQHDLFIPNLGLKITNSDVDVYTANVFTKEANKKEYVSQVGISNVIQETTADIYVSPTGSLNIDNAQLVKSDVKLPIGYKAVDFEPIEVENEKFAIIVKYKEKTDVSVERPDTHFNLYATGNANESFCSLDGKAWADLNKINPNLSNANFTIKAFTTNDNVPTPDTTAPQITFDPDGSSTPKSTHTTKVTVKDNVAVDESSIKYVWTQSTEKPDDSSFTNSCKNGDEVTAKFAKGIYYLWVMAKDTTGNTAYTCSKAFDFDDTLPQAPSLTASAQQNVYTKEDVTITIVDNEGWDGLSGYQYSLDNGTTWIYYNDTSRVFKETGTYNVIARSVGANGKCSEVTPVYVIKIDKDTPQPPRLSANVSNGASSRDDVRITITGGETPSGIKNYQYKLNRDDDWRDLDTGNTIDIKETGYYYVRVRAINNVGTVGSSSSEYMFGIVREGIIVEFTPNGKQEYSKKVNVNVKITASGIIRTSKYLWSTKSEGITADDIKNDFKTGDTITKDSGSGDWYLWVYVTDNDANRFVQRSEVFRLDNTVPNAPQVTKKNSTKKSVTLEFSGSESLSGIDKYQYTLDYGNSWTDVKINSDGKATLIIDKPGQYNVAARAVNKVGTSGEMSSNVGVKIEKDDGNNGNNNNNNNNNGNNGNNGNNNNNNNNGNNNNGNNSNNNNNNGNKNNNSNNNKNNSGGNVNSGSSQNSNGAQNNSKNSGSTIGSTKYNGTIPNTGLDFARLVAAFTVAIVVTVLTVIGMAVKEKIDK